MTIKDILEQTVARTPDRAAIRFKAGGQWESRTFSDVRNRARVVSEVCASQGVEPGDRVGLYRENSREWFEIYLGIIALGAIAVPVDAGLREQEVLHVLRDAGVKVLFASARFYPLLESVVAKIPSLKSVVLLEGTTVLPLSGEPVEYLDYGACCTTCRDLADGSGAAYDRGGPSQDDPASIIYTSGTTGRQKGAVLTHHNFVANVRSCLEVLEVQEGDRFLIVLPLHHSFAFTALFLMPLYTGCEVHLVESLRTVAQNMAETKPTILMAVPLLLEKMQARIMENIRRKPAARLLLAVGLGRIAGKAVVRKLGGSLRLLISGAAPCDPAMLRTWERLGIPVLEGYGITETGPVLCVNPPGKVRHGTVGSAIPDVEIRIDEPNEEGVGEILARGPNIMQGYWNQPEATQEVLRDGWYHTGDLGSLDQDGYLTISGRKKNLIVNREGKNIYPEEVERQLLKSPFISECLVLGYQDAEGATGERVGVIAIPDLETFADDPQYDDRPDDAAIEQRVRSEIKKQAEMLAPYKRPRLIEVRFDEFEKTSTAKIKRHLYALHPGRGDIS